MGTKRAAAQIHPSRQSQVPHERPHPRKKHKADSTSSFSFPNSKPHSTAPATTHPVNTLKAHIRSLHRLLSKPDLRPDIRIEKERALATAQKSLETNSRAQKRNAVIGKYHKIRFFERQKATKRLKKAQKAYEACGVDEGDERARLRGLVGDAEVDLNYALYYPLERNYVSLFPRESGKAGGLDEEGEGEKVVERKGDPVMWSRVRDCMANGTLHALRNGKFIEEGVRVGEKADVSSGRKKEKGTKGSGTKDKKGRKEEEEKDEDAESDGGFFE